MSIVGPRPHAVAHNEEYRQLIKAYMVRHKVKPGITGWAQINGQRGETDTIEKMQARVEYDLEYLRNWSLGLDLQIIAAHRSSCCSSTAMRTETHGCGACEAPIVAASLGATSPMKNNPSVAAAACAARLRSPTMLSVVGGVARRRRRPRAAPSDPNPYYLGVSAGLHPRFQRAIDGRRSGSPATTTRPRALLGGFDQPIGRQRLFGNATVTREPLPATGPAQQHQLHASPAGSTGQTIERPLGQR